MSWKPCSFKILLAILAWGNLCRGQTSTVQTEQILSRLDQLEKENQQLLEEIKALREEVQQNAATQNRIPELQQTKVEAAQKFPVTLTGMILFDTSLVYGTKNDSFQQEYSDLSEGYPGGYATFNQSIIGFRFQGPQVFADGRVNAFASMDFYDEDGGYGAFRLRRAGISINWPNGTLTFAQDKPVISPYEPTSYAHVAIPPLAGAGNLWLWRPQVRYDQRFRLREDVGVTLSGAVFETNENYGSDSYIAAPRPALQLRGEVSQTKADVPTFSVGAGMDASESHIGGRSLPTRLANLDLLYHPLTKIQLTGDLFYGENFSNLGGVDAGINLIDGRYVAVHGAGGWAQAAYSATNRLTFDLYSGRQINRGSDITSDQIARTLVVAANGLYRIGPNVILGLEAGHENVTFLDRVDISARRFDATVAYLF